MHRRFLPYEDEAPGVFIIITPFDNAAQTCYMAGGPLHLHHNRHSTVTSIHVKKKKKKKKKEAGEAGTLPPIFATLEQAND